MRVFIAISVPEAARRELEGISARYRDELGECRISWTRAENYHITLKFLGEVADDRVSRVCNAVQSCELGPAFVLRPSEIASFPPRGPARVIVAKLIGDVEAAAVLARRIDRLCNGLGFALERRPFTPHITLGRPRSRLFMETRRVDGSPFLWDAVHVMSSAQVAGGSVYCSLARFTLSAPSI